MRQYQAGLETIPQAHLQILPLHPVHGLCWCQCESFLLLCAIEFFFSKFYSAAHQVTISTLIIACDLDDGRAGASGENQVKLVPLLRSWVSSGDCVGA